ncbi:MAG: tRNA (adenosine(37)-N6)-threonylcarbamoyltransferase complex ATPase subunit type 1 TsaE [Myxococcales bacterium]|nr:tRNA (adenosine(37)-N6)-threonylcarbamoyltransferase complex ATPase subunit type 1 TsaE [Myxococcales bacterium]
MLLETREATQAMARRLATHIIAGDVILLDGELGAGKTFFAGALIHALGVPEQMFVTSPTFTLIHQYRGRLPIYHADSFRLDDPKELLTLGLREALEEEAVVIVEWGKKLAPFLHTPWLGLEFELFDENARTVRWSGTGTRPKTLIDLAAQRRL